MNDKANAIMVGATNPKTLADVEELCQRARALGMTDFAECDLSFSKIKFAQAVDDMDES